MTEREILYSFRRCPYAIRARLAIFVSGQVVELREILLRDKAPEFLDTSPSETVPCLKTGETVIDESLDIMLWALSRNDPEDWLRPGGADLDAALELIRACDGPFKNHLDRYKYDTRHPDADRDQERQAGAVFLTHLNDALIRERWLLGPRASIADYAILPFVRQFANTDRSWFDAQDWHALVCWLEAFEGSELYHAVMHKWSRWRTCDAPVLFPERRPGQTATR